MQEGQVRPGNVLKVDCFLNHQLDVDLLDKVCLLYTSDAADEDSPV